MSVKHLAFSASPPRIKDTIRLLLSKMPPTPGDVALTATRRAELLQGRIAPLATELARLVSEMSTQAPDSARRARTKARAKTVLRQKKALERRLEAALNTQFNMALVEDAAEARRAAINDHALLDRIRIELESGDVQALRAVKAEVDDVQRMLAEPLGDDDGLDEELEAELKRDCGAAAGEALSEDALRVEAAVAPKGPAGPLGGDDDFTEAAHNSRARVDRRGQGK